MTEKPTGNPNIVKYAEGHRFGDPGGPDPSAAAKKGNKDRASVRRQSRVLANMTVGDAKELMANIDEISVAQAVALAKFQKAMKGDTKAMQQFTDDVDGKLVDRQVQAEVTLSDLVTGSLEYDDEFSREGVIDVEPETSTQADSPVEA